MIHQFIFASPKPGMSEKEFHNYWVKKHAVEYASKIKEIKKYAIDTRIIDANPNPLFSGIAEIWIKQEEQLQSLQSAPFLEGARLDEPRWAAFWKTLVLDTHETMIVEGPQKENNPTWIKNIMLIKRKPGMELEEFRLRMKLIHAPQVAKIDGLKGYSQCFVVDGAYQVGEASFDAVEVLWFENASTEAQAIKANYHSDIVAPTLGSMIDLKHFFCLSTNENWIIGPEARD